MFKKRTQRGNVRKKRDASDGDGSEESPLEAERSAAKRRAIGGDVAGAKGDEQGKVVASEVVRDEIGRDRAKANAFSTSGSGTTKDSLLFRDESAGATYHVSRGGATATNEIDTAPDRDARAIAERNLKMTQEGSTNDETKTYHGQAGYKSYIEKDAAAIGNNKNTGTQGPIRAPAFFRATCRFDYQPDVCKDYKDTGFCGFGDSCKFMHDRGNYKTGWQMEKEWEEQSARRKELISMGLDPDKDDSQSGADQYAVGGCSADDLPFACYLCRGPFNDPVVTKCGHHFCRKCIVTSFKSAGPNCPVCSKNTSGIFNVSRKLAALGAKHGGFQNLFKTMSGDGGQVADGRGDEADESSNGNGSGNGGGGGGGGGNSNDTSTTNEAVRGKWAVADDDEGGWDSSVNESGVAELLEKEAEERRQREEESAAKEAAAAAAAAQQKIQAEAEEARLASAAATLGWQRVKALGDAAKMYWFNAAKNQTCWEVPLEVKNLLRGGNPDAPAATATWQPAQDNQGRTYYYNSTTMETSWTPP